MSVQTVREVISPTGTVTLRHRGAGRLIITYTDGSPDWEVELGAWMDHVVRVLFIGDSECIVLAFRDVTGTLNPFGLCRLNFAARQVVWCDEDFSVDIIRYELVVEGDRIILRGENTHRSETHRDLATGQQVLCQRWKR